MCSHGSPTVPSTLTMASAQKLKTITTTAAKLMCCGRHHERARACGCQLECDLPLQLFSKSFEERQQRKQTKGS